MSYSSSIIGLAAFLHDIGKLAERGSKELRNFDSSENKEIYLPFNENQNRHTHYHALYTAKVVEEWLNHFPDWIYNAREILRENKDLPVENSDSLINLSSKHHKPDTILQKLIAIADRIASSLDRQQFDNYNKEINVKDYKNTRLLSIFERINLDQKKTKNSYEEFEYVYEIDSNKNLDSFFPKKKSDIKKDYKDLWDRLEKEFNVLSFENDYFLFIDRILSFFELYLTFVPAVTVGRTIPDISLFDHSKIVAAIAVALFQYYSLKKNWKEIENLNYESISGEPFLLIQTNFFGIQKYIFEDTDTKKNAAKILRARSLMIQILQDILALWIIEELQLNPFSILLNSAGKTLILAGNLEENKKKLKEIQLEINNWFLKNYFGEVGIGINWISLSVKDLLKPESLQERLKALSIIEEEFKYQKWGFLTYKESQYNEEGHLCDFCKKRISTKTKEEYQCCDICDLQIELGKEVFKSHFLIILKEENGSIFNRFNFYTKKQSELTNFLLKSKSQILKCIAFDINNFYKFSLTSFKRNYFGYIPKENEVPLSFDEISQKGLIEVEEKYYGVPYLGVLKADVDNLGLIFQKGIPDFNISRMVTLSRMLNDFFSIYVVDLLKSTNIYMVFAGGDDLFLIGPYNEIIKISEEVYKKFREYTCHNQDITISMGISFHKKNDPILYMAEQSEEMLNLAKKEKDSIAIFEVSVKWKEFIDNKKILNSIDTDLKEEVLSRSLLYKILEILYIFLQSKKENFKKNYSALSWRSKLYYFLARNVNIKEDNLKQKVKTRIENFTDWIQNHPNLLKIFMILILYEHRKFKKEE